VRGRLFIDVDGTLVSKDDEPRPFLDQFFKEMDGIFDVIVWSAGGKDYAKMKTRNTRLDIQRYVSRYDSKYNFVVKYRPRPGDVCIDDDPNVVEVFDSHGAKGYKVPFYEPHLNGPDRTSNELALEEVRNEILKRLRYVNGKENGIAKDDI
jgi:hypothetical protein